jgi:hypothetical protein
MGVEICSSNHLRRVPTGGGVVGALFFLLFGIMVRVRAGEVRYG